MRYARRFDYEDGQRAPTRRRRGGLVAAAEPNTGSDRGRRGGYAGEFDAISPPERVSELGDVAGNAGYKLVPFGASCPANGYYPDS